MVLSAGVRSAAVRRSAGVAALVLALAACSDDGEGGTSAGSTPSVTAEATTEATPTQTEEESPSPTEADPRAALEQAVEQTSAQESARVELAVQTDVAGQMSGTNGEGVVAIGEAQRAQLTLSLPPEAGGGQVEVRVVDGITYVQIPEAAETGLPIDIAGKFLRVDPGAEGAAGFGGLGELGGSAGGFSDSLEQLRGAESVERAGEGEVAGEQVTLYEVTTSTSTGGSPAPEGVPDQITYTVAVDDEDLIREIRSDVPLDVDPGAGTPDPSSVGTVGVSFTILEYGVPLDVQVPPADQIVDLSQFTG